MRPEYGGQNHEIALRQPTEPPPEKERLFAALQSEEQLLVKEFTNDQLSVAREKIIVGLFKKTLSEPVQTYLKEIHPELITEAAILLTKKDTESVRRLYELVPSHQWSANLIRQTSARKAGYFVHPHSAEQNEAWLLKGLHKSIEGADGMRIYKKYNWREAEERYYDDLLDNAGITATWNACSPEELHKLELAIAGELHAGTMPFRVREYLTLRLPSVLSTSTIELLKNPPEAAAPPGLVSDLKNLTDHEQKILHSTPEETLRKLRRRAETSRARFPKLVDQNMKKALVETIFSESLSADQLRQDPILSAWTPTEEEMTEIRQKTREKTEHLLQKLREPSSRVTFAEVNEDLHPPHSIRLAQAPVPTDTFIVLQKIWPACLEQKGFFDGFDPKKLTALLHNNIPDRHYRSFITQTFALAKEHGHLTAELVQALATVKYDDQLLQNFWEIVERDPRYAPTILGRIRDPLLREQLFAECNLPPITTFVADNILSMARDYRLKCQNLNHKRKKIDELEEELSNITDPRLKIEKEGALDIELQKYVEAIRETEELSTYAEQHFQSVEDCLKTGVVLATNNFGDTASALETAKELAFLVTSSNDALAEKAANTVEQQLSSLTAEELETTSYSKTLAHDRLFAALITRSTPEQEIVLHQKLADYLRPYDLHEDTRQLTRAWKASFSGQEYKINLFEKIGENLSVIHAIEKRFPSGCKILLEEFGIKNFARYGAAILLKQLEERNDTTKTYGTILFPGDDYNGAFYQSKAVFETLLNQLQKEGIALRVTEARTGLQAASQNRKLQRRYGQASFCFAGGHGNVDGLTLGSTKHATALPVISRQHLSHERVKRSGDFLKDGSQIILVSCSTGKEDGFAQKLSETYGRDIQVTGPDVPTNLKSIKLISTNPIRFHIEYQEELVAREYVAGKRE